MKRLSFIDLPLSGLKLVERKRLADSRGFFARLFCADEMASLGWLTPLSQINQSFTAKRGTVRGMHFQLAPHTETKLVSCLQGEIWDVAVDLRAGSKTFLQYHAELLSAENGRALLLPEGFAHGFQSITDNVELIYCHSSAYNSDAEAGLNPFDPRLDIKWPLPIGEVSSRDAQRKMLQADFEGLNK